MAKNLFQKGQHASKKTEFKTGEKQVEIARRAGIKSGEAKREKKSSREKLKYILSLDVNEKEQQMVDKTFKDFKQIADNSDLILMSLLQKAKKGDTKAIELILKLQGEIIDKIAQTDTEGNNLPPTFIIGSPDDEPKQD